MTILDYYWTTNKDWWHWTDDFDRVINDDAPKEAKESYQRYLEQSEADRKRGTI